MDLELIGVGISDRGFLPLWTSPSQFFFFFSNSFLFFSFLPLCVLAPLRLCVSFFPRLLFPFASLHLGHFSFKV
jgi:hypothetical protein